MTVHSSMQRPLSAMERVVWLSSLRLPINFTLTARFDDRLDQESLKSAVRRLLPSRPLLCSRIVQDGDFARFVPALESTCPIRVVQPDSEDAWVSVMREELLTPFPCDTGPLARFTLIPHRASSDLVLCCHHCNADGLSAAYLLQDLLRLLADPSERPAPEPLSQSLVDLIPAEASSRPALRIALLAAKILGGFGMQGIRLVSRLKRRNHGRTAPCPGYGLRVIAWCLDQEQTESVAARSRRERTTVHAALCSAFLTAFAEREKSKVRAVSSPVNLRQRLQPPVGNAFGLYICLAKVSVDVSRSSFWDTARELKTKLDRANLWWGPLFAEKVLSGRSNSEINRLMETMGPPKVNYDLSVTNLGRLTFPGYAGVPRLRSVHGPAVGGVEGERILGVSTAAGRMSFVFTFPVQTLQQEAALRIRDTAMSVLANACGFGF